MTVVRLTPLSTRAITERGDERAELPQMPARGTGSGDRQLLRAAALGEAVAWDALVDAHAQAVWDTARASGLDRSEAAEVCDVVWRRLAQSLPLSAPQPLSIWLRQVAIVESDRARARVMHRAARPWDGVERRRQRRVSF